MTKKEKEGGERGTDGKKPGHHEKKVRTERGSVRRKNIFCE